MPVSQTSDEVIDIHGSGKRAHLRSGICALAAATLVISCSTADPEPQLSPSAESAESFDAPIGMETVDLGASPYYRAGEDSPRTALSAYNERASSSSRVGVVSTQAGYVLKYLRAAGAGCDLHSEGSACWDRIKAQFSLQRDEMPLCTGYEHVPDQLGTDHVESQVAYPVEVALSPLPAMRVSPAR